MGDNYYNLGITWIYKIDGRGICKVELKNILLMKRICIK
jgi:hypothetical protein